MIVGLGKNVGKLIKARGESYAKVARGIGIDDPQAIWALVKRNSKKSDFASRLALYFGVPLDRLLADDFEPEESLLRRPSAEYDGALRVHPAQGDAEKLLVVIRAFLDTDTEGRAELVKAAASVTKAHGASLPAHSRRVKRR